MADAVLDRSIEQSIDWNRAIIIDQGIDDELVKRLTPVILKLRQENNRPITIGIDSPGGSLTSLDVLLGLLTGPNQDGEFGKIVTVTTNRAYSAAANFLAFGTYAVALKHSQILYHDVRYGGMEDVTPEKARNAAKSLQDVNDTFSLKLANKIIQRLIWVYLDLQMGFEDENKKLPNTFKRFDGIVSAFAPRIPGQHSVDIASFATSLYAKLSSDNDTLIRNVMKRLSRWIMLTKLVDSIPTYRIKGSKIPGLLDGAKHMHKHMAGSEAKDFALIERNLKLTLTLLISGISQEDVGSSSFTSVLENTTRDFILIESMNDEQHIKSAAELMLRHEVIFYGRRISKELEGKTDEEKQSIISTAAPYAHLFWHFCVALCRELFEGEHILKPHDAQLLGLIDEIAGGGPIESRRDYNKKKLAAAAKAAEAKAAADALVVTKPKAAVKPKAAKAAN